MACGPRLVEAIACREALSLAEDLCIHHPYIASDCKVVNEIHDGVGGSYGGIIKEIKQIEGCLVHVLLFMSFELLILKLISWLS